MWKFLAEEKQQALKALNFKLNPALTCNLSVIGDHLRPELKERADPNN